MQYKTCTYCGSNLDFGERCDCRDREYMNHEKINKYVNNNLKRENDGQMRFVFSPQWKGAMYE